MYESELIQDELVSKIIKKLQKDNFVYKGKLDPPKGEIDKNWKTRNLLLFNSLIALILLSMSNDEQDVRINKTINNIFFIN